MQDLKKSRKKMNNKQMSNMKIKNPMPIIEEEVEVEDLDRGCNKSKHTSNNSCGCNNSNTSNASNSGCECKDKCGESANNQSYTCVCTPTSAANSTCEPCDVESDVCVENPCSNEECCCPISPNFTTKNATPVAIEADRIYDAVQFQIFTDATGPDGEPLYFDYEVAEVIGRVPTSGLANVKITEVCMNYSSIEVNPGVVSVEDFEVNEIEDDNDCDTEFKYSVCPERNATCCAQCKGQSVSYKQKGLTVVVNDLVLELKGHCGCTKIVAYAYPAIRRMGGQLCRVDSVEFDYNTLSARLCCPSSGKSFELRQDYDLSLTVDCISKAYITAQENYDCDCDCSFYLEIPSGIDLICCVQEEVSVIVNQQIVVMGVTDAVNPRTVDTFANVCSFPSCPGSGN